MVEATAQAMDELTAKIKRPPALAVFDGDAVVVRYCTIPNSPLSLLYSSLNMRLSLVSSAPLRDLSATVTARLASLDCRA